MIRKIATAMMTIIICLGVFAMAPASAQSSSGATWQDEVSQHHRMQYQMMKDMTEVMGRMTDQMLQGEITPEQRKQMAQRMAVMSTMMRRMSGLQARSAMKGSEWRKQMDQMRKQMDEMMRDSQMAPGAR